MKKIFLKTFAVFMFFFNGLTAPRGPRPPHFSRLHDHTFLDTPHSVGLLWTSDQQRPDNTQHSQQTDIRAPGRIRTHNPSKRAAADPRQRPQDHCDRHSVYDIYQG
jgi:hypothetical protein